MPKRAITTGFEAFNSSQLKNRSEYLKITDLPDPISIDVSPHIDEAIAAVKDCHRLINNLQGIFGGGSGPLPSSTGHAYFPHASRIVCRRRPAMAKAIAPAARGAGCPGP